MCSEWSVEEVAAGVWVHLDTMCLQWSVEDGAGGAITTVVGEAMQPSFLPLDKHHDGSVSQPLDPVGWFDWVAASWALTRRLNKGDKPQIYS